MFFILVFLSSIYRESSITNVNSAILHFNGPCGPILLLQGEALVVRLHNVKIGLVSVVILFCGHSNVQIKSSGTLTAAADRQLQRWTALIRLPPSFFQLNQSIKGIVQGSRMWNYIFVFFCDNKIPRRKWLIFK